MGDFRSPSPGERKGLAAMFRTAELGSVAGTRHWNEPSAAGRRLCGERSHFAFGFEAFGILISRGLDP